MGNSIYYDENDKPYAICGILDAIDGYRAKLSDAKIIRYIDTEEGEDNLEKITVIGEKEFLEFDCLVISDLTDIAEKEIREMPVVKYSEKDSWIENLGK